MGTLRNSVGKQSEIKIRQSNIELLKIIAMFLIVLSHCVPFKYGGTGLNNYNIEQCSEDISVVLLAVLRYMGQIGNAVFIVCSCWFLNDSNSTSTEKVLNVLTDTLFFSLFNLVIFILCGVRPTLMEVLRSFLPNTFRNNWFISCYLIFYIIHPVINSIIKELNQRKHLITVMLGTIIYSILDNIDVHRGKDSSNLIYFVLILFIVSYIKKYLPNFGEKIRLNAIIFGVSFICIIAAVFTINFVGLRMDFLYDKLLLLNWFNNPLFLLMAISLFNLFQFVDINSSIINSISSVTLYIYMIHDNLLVGSYLRPSIWQLIFERIGNSKEYVELWSLVFSAAMFVASTLIAIIYKYTLKKLVSNLCRFINKKGKIICNRIIDYCISFK